MRFSQERAAAVAWKLRGVRRLSVAEIARITELKPAHAAQLAAVLAECLPVAVVDEWCMVVSANGQSAPRLAEQRAAVLAWRLADGERYTVRGAAELVGVARNTASVLLRRISYVVPIYDAAGVWRRCEWQ